MGEKGRGGVRLYPAMTFEDTVVWDPTRRRRGRGATVDARGFHDGVGFPGEVAPRARRGRCRPLPSA
jgi:hypothetical protein